MRVRNVSVVTGASGVTAFVPVCGLFRDAPALTGGRRLAAR